MVRVTILSGCSLILMVTYIMGGAAAPPPSGIHILDGLCMTDRSDRLVYRHKNNTHVYIAFDVLRTGKVEVFSWKIVKANNGTFISKMTKQDIPAVDFRKQVNRDHILGGCSRRNYKKFKSRLNRKMKNCVRLLEKKRKHCKMTAIMEVFIRTKFRNVNFVKDCKTM